MQISTERLGEGVYEGIIQEKDNGYVLSQLNRHAYLTHASEDSLSEYEDDFAAVKGHLTVQLDEEDDKTSTTGEFCLNILEVGEVLGTTDDGHVVSEFEDGLYVSSFDRYDPDTVGEKQEYDLDEPELPLW